MQYEKLSVVIDLRLRGRADLAAVESGNDLGHLINSESSEPVTQVADRFGMRRIRQFASPQDVASVDPFINVVNGYAEGNVFQQRPLRAAHASYLGQQTQMRIENSEAWHIQQRPSQNVAAGKDYDVGRPFRQLLYRSW